MAIWTAVALTLLIRVGTGFALKTYKLGTADNYLEIGKEWRRHWEFGYEWGRIAKWLVQINLFSFDGRTPTADTDPLYSFIIAPFFYVFGVYTIPAAVALIIFQSLLCALTTWAIFVLAEKLYGPLEARFAAIMFAFYPASIFFAVSRIAPSSLSVLLLCLCFIAALAVPASQRGPRMAILSGLLMGLVVLSSSDTLSVFLVVPLWLFVIGTGRRLRMIRTGIVAVGTAMLVLLPWSIRNSLVIDEPTISKANLGYHLWVGNNPNATGVLFTSVPPDLPDLTVTSSKLKPQSQFYAQAISWIVQHPKEFAVLTLKRIQYFWYTIPERGNIRKGILAGLVLLAMVAVAVGGVFFPGQNFKNVGLLLLFVGIYPLVFYFTHASFYRHRYHVEPFVLILASRGFAGLWAYYRAGRVKTIAEMSATPTASKNRQVV